MLDFLGSLELERGLARNTLEADQTDLRQLSQHLEASGSDLLNADRADLAAWLDSLALAGVSNATMRRKVGTAGCAERS